jgi:hypothetical protein
MKLDERQSQSWNRYQDDQTGAFYWFNYETHESRWDGESDYGQFYDHRNDNGEIFPIIDSSKAASFPSASIDEVCYIRFSLVNAVLFEGPLCLLEGFGRLSILILLLVYCCLTEARESSKPDFKRTTTIFRDIILTTVAMSVLIIPGYILSVYSQCDPRSSWQLVPIPTYLGPIDCRRFLMITLFGLGRLAANHSIVVSRSNVRKNNNNNHDTKKNTIQSMDIWENSLFYYPKDIFAFLSTYERIK